ncbi:MAG TPA: DUF1778 domain-containing protein, partial [Chloroflexota bacterium]
MIEVKDERLQVRVERKTKRVLEEAANAVHLSVSAFVLQAAAVRAEEILAERQLINLSPEAAEAFSGALARPATVNERLDQTLRR